MRCEGTKVDRPASDLGFSERFKMEVTHGTNHVDGCSARRDVGVYGVNPRTGGRDLVCGHDFDLGVI